MLSNLKNMYINESAAKDNDWLRNAHSSSFLDHQHSANFPAEGQRSRMCRVGKTVRNAGKYTDTSFSLCSSGEEPTERRPANYATRKYRVERTARARGNGSFLEALGAVASHARAFGSSGSRDRQKRGVKVRGSPDRSCANFSHSPSTPIFRETDPGSEYGGPKNSLANRNSCFLPAIIRSLLGLILGGLSGLLAIPSIEPLQHWVESSPKSSLTQPGPYSL